MKSLSTLLLPALLLTVPLSLQAEPQWIWLSKTAKTGQQVTLKKTFDVVGAVKSASLLFTVDNGAKAYLNNQIVGQNPDWEQPTKVDVTKFLKAGANEIRLDATNEGSTAAAVAILTITMADGKKVVIETGGDWQAATTGTTNFQPAFVMGKYGVGPWGDALGNGASSGGGKTGPVAAADSLQLPKGFKAELIYVVPKGQQGSWVSLATDPKGRLLACDQQGGLFRVTVPALTTKNALEETKVEALTMPADVNGKPLGGAHGLLYAFNSLYFMNNEKAGKGLWRLRDLDGDDQFEKADYLRPMDGSGEHGPHSLVLSPDGKSIYFCNGNHTKPVAHLELSRAARAWQEDHLMARLWDANGHAKGILAPGGCIYKTDPDGKTVELVSYGYRNEFDFGFDAQGELFAYDADMEWDIAAPWYRPTRICLATSGSDLGWRSGAGKWPPYYPDSIPAVLDIGPGSPTGVVFGTGAKFPVKYQRALYGLDWTYGTMYAVHFTPDGAGFKAEKEEFVAGKPLPLTDAVINPKDGAMYFAVGGRGTQSALYRVTYTGTESTAPAAPYTMTAEAKVRHELEQLHENGTGPEAIAKAWPYLSHADRLIRTAARVAIERQPVDKWADQALAEKNPQAAIEALIALSRVGRSEAAAAGAMAAQKKSGVSSGPVQQTPAEDVALQKKVVEALGRLDFKTVSPNLRQPLLRAWGLCFTRFGKPDAETCKGVAAKLDSLYPDADPLINRELVQLLVFLDSTTVVAKTVPQLAIVRDVAEDIATDSLLARNEGYASAARTMQASRPNRQAMALAYSLRNATVGWTPELRKTFFAWFPSTRGWKGGNSFNGFLNNIRTEALANFVPDDERDALDAMSKKPAAGINVGTILPKGPGRAWTVAEVEKLGAGGFTGRNFERGKGMFSATLCAACHKFAGDGGNIGPDLTGVGNRYTIKDLAENILEPSKVISDQYGSEELHTKDGTLVIGRVVGEENGKLMVMTSPLTPADLTAVPVANVKERKPWGTSMMPPGLINALSDEELKDLLAYLMSGGKPEDKAFQK